MVAAYRAELHLSACEPAHMPGARTPAINDSYSEFGRTIPTATLAKAIPVSYTVRDSNIGAEVVSRLEIRETSMEPSPSDNMVRPESH